VGQFEMSGLDRGCVKTQRCDWTAEYSSVVAFCRAGLFRFNGSLGRTQQIIAPNRYAGAFLHSLDPKRTFDNVAADRRSDHRQGTGMGVCSGDISPKLHKRIGLRTAGERERRVARSKIASIRRVLTRQAMNAAVISSVMPAVKYGCLASLSMFWNGSTVIEGQLVGGGTGRESAKGCGARRQR